MREDIKQLICNYWDLHGTFDGIEKTPLLEELQRIGKPCADIPVYQDKGFSVCVDMFATDIGKCQFTQQLSNDELKSVLLLSNYVISAPNCIVMTEDENQIRTALLARGLENNKVKKKQIVKKAVEQINVVEAQDVAMFGNVLYTPCDEGLVKSNAIALINAIMRVCSSGLSDKKVFMLRLLDRDAYYFKIVALAKSFGLTVSDVCNIYNHTMPDMMLGVTNFNSTFIMFDDDDVLRYTSTGSECLTRAQFAAELIQHAQQMQALQQLGAF